MSEASPTLESGPLPLAAPSEGALPEGARLAEFEIRRVLGAGGFGMVYLAWDHALEREVALKEYMPFALAARGRDQRLTIRSAGQQETFALGLRSFVNEARLLARFDHPSLVKVYRFWEANGTAYMAMPMYHGRTLRQARQQMRASPGEAWCRGLLQPLLGALDCLHREEVYHRDIAPDNIVLAEGGRPVLLDFGAARRVLSDRTHALTAILKPSFAPIEQYADVASLRQGPWTDLYGVAATFYYLLTGQPPLAAAARAVADELPPLARLRPEGCGEVFLRALDWAMAVRPQDRPQSIAVWCQALDGLASPPAGAQALAPGPVPGLAAPEAPAGFGPTVALPPGSTPGGAAVWRGFTVPQTAAGPRGSGRPDASSPAATATVRRRWGRAAVLALAGVLAGVAGWRVAGWRVAAPSVPAPLSAQAGSAVRVEVGPPLAAPPVSAVALSPAALPPQAGRDVAAPAVSSAAAALSSASGPPAQNPRRAGRAAVAEHRAMAAGVPGPRVQCADRLFLSRLLCMKRVCDTDTRLRRHPQCVEMRQAEEARRQREARL